MSSLETRFIFGAGLDLDLLGIEIDDKTLIPGLAVASSRATALAGIKLQIFHIFFVNIHLVSITDLLYYFQELYRFKMDFSAWNQ